MLDLLHWHYKQLSFSLSKTLAKKGKTSEKEAITVNPVKKYTHISGLATEQVLIFEAVLSGGGGVR